MPRQLTVLLKKIFARKSSKLMSDTSSPLKTPDGQRSHETSDTEYESITRKDGIEVLRYTDPQTGSTNDVIVLPEWALD